MGKARRKGSRPSDESKNKDGSANAPGRNDAKLPRKPKLKVETLEERILLSATWADADTGDATSGPTSGNDLMTGDAEANVADGGGDHRQLFGFGGNDILSGGSGNDLLDGGEGDDTLSGGTGSDTLTGGEGTDRVSYANAAAGVTVDLTAGTASGGDGTDTLSSIEAVTGSNYNDTFNFSTPADGATYTIDGGGGTNTLNLSGFSSSAVTFGDGSMTVAMEDGGSFTINYSNIDTVDFSDVDATVLDGDTSVNALSGSRIFIEGDEAFRIDVTGGGSADLSYNATTDTLTITDTDNTSSATALSINDLTGTDLAIGSITVDGNLASLTSDANITALTINDDCVVTAITVGGGTGTIGSLSFADAVEEPTTISANLGALTVHADVESALTVNGSVSGNAVFEGEIKSGGSVIITGAAGSLSVELDISGVLSTGAVSGAVSLDAEIKSGAHVTIGGTCGSLIVGGHVSGDLTTGAVTGAVQLDAEVKSSATVTIGGACGSLSVAQDVSGTLQTGAVSGSVTLTAEVKSGGVLTIGGSCASLSVGGPVSGTVTTAAVTGDASLTQIASGGVVSLGGAVGDDVIVTGSLDGHLILGASADDVVLSAGIASGATLSATGTYDDISVSGAMLGTMTVTGSADTVTLSSTGHTGNVTVTGDLRSFASGGFTGTLTVGNPNGSMTITNGSYTHTDSWSNNADSITYNGSTQVTTQTGSSSNDTLVSGSGNDTINGGSGSDTVTYSDATSGVTVNMSTGTVTGHGTDTLQSIEGVTGSSYDDTMTAGSTAVTLSGASGNDTISGGAGSDTLYGGTGNDTITGGAGNDLIQVGSGNDTVDGGTGTDNLRFLEASAGVTVDMTAGTGTGTSGTTTFSNIENVTGSNYSDTITGNSSNNTIYTTSGTDIVDGGAGTDTLNLGYGYGATVDMSAGTATGTNLNTTFSNIENVTGSGYGDTITGSSGNNTISGGSGNDVIRGGGGNDTLAGDSGNDTIYSGSGNDVINGGGDTDTLSYEDASSGVTVNLGLTTAQNTSGAGTDTISNMENLTSSAHNDTLTGSTGNNVIRGGEGDDVISAGAGNDTVYGGSGDDTIDGGSGTDTVNYSGAEGGMTVDLTTGTASGEGTDTLTGIEGVTGSSHADTISFDNPVAGATYTVDGGSGTDTIDLSGFDAGDVTWGTSGGSITISLGGGQSFIINYTGIETIELGDATASVVSSDTTLSEVTGQRIIIDGGQVFSVTVTGGGSVDLSYAPASDSLSITDNEGMTGATAIAITDLTGTDLTVSALTFDEPVPSLTSNVNLGTVTVNAEEGISSLSVRDGAGTISSLVIGTDLTGDMDVNATVASITVSGDLDGSVEFSGPVTTMSVTGAATGSIAFESTLGALSTGNLSAELEFGGNVGTIQSSGTVSSDLTIPGTLTSLTATGLTGDLAVTGNVGTVLISGNISGNLDLDGNLTLLSVTGATSGAIAVEGSVTSIQAGTLGATGILDINGSVGTITATNLTAAMDIAGDLNTVNVSGDISSSITMRAVSGSLNITDGGSSVSHTFSSATLAIYSGSSDSLWYSGMPEAPTDLVFDASTVSEDAANGTVVTGVTVVDPSIGEDHTFELTESAGGRFSIDAATGEIVIANASLLNYASAPSHTITVRVTDSTGLTYSESLTINLLNGNEAPTDLSLSGNSVVENASDGTVIGSVSVTDADDDDTHTFALTSDASGRFAIDPDTGEITVADGSLLNYEAATSHTVTVRVTDAAGATYDETFTINLTNLNEGPSDLALDGDSVAENATDGTVVGSVSVTDVDAGDSHSFELTSDAGGRFTIDPDTGEITVADGSLLNYEAATSHTVTVRVTDASGATYDETFTINLTNANEGPSELTIAGGTVSENAAAGTYVATASATDPDSGESMTYSLSDDAEGRFEIDPATGVITVAEGGSLNYETGQSHQITVRATDSSGESVDRTIDIDVANVVETFVLSGNGTLHASDGPFENVVINGGYLTIDGNVEIQGDLTIQNAASISGGTLSVHGDVTTTDTSLSGSSIIVLAGDGPQSISTGAGSGELCNVSITNTSGEVTIGGALQISGSYTDNGNIVDATGATVELQGNASVSGAGTSFGDVTFNGGYFTVPEMHVGGNLTLTSAASINGGSIFVEGDVTTTDTSYSGSAVIVLSGDGAQTISTGGGSGELNKVSITNSSGEVAIEGSLQISGSYADNGNTVDATGATVELQGNATVSGAATTFSNVTLNGGYFTIAEMHVDGDLTLTSAASINGGTISVSGDVTTTDVSYSGTAVISLVGDGPQTISTGAGAGELCNVSIANTSGEVTIAGALQISGSYADNGNTVDATGATVELQGNASVSGAGTTFGNVTLNGGYFTISAMDVDGDLTLTSAASINGGTISVSGDVTTTDVSYSGTAVISLAGDGPQTISTGAGAGELCNVSIANTSGEVTIEGALQISGTYADNGNTVDATGATVELQGNASVSGAGTAFGDVTFNGGYFTVPEMHVGGSLTLTSAASINGGSIFVEGDVTTTDTSYSGSAVIVLSGDGPQTISTGGGSGELNRVSITNSSGEVTIEGPLQISGSYSDGGNSVDATGASVELQGNASLTGSGTRFGNMSLNGGYLDLASDVYVEGDLTVQSLVRLNGGTIFVAGDITEIDTSWSGTGDIQHWEMNEAPADLALDRNSIAENAANGTVVGSVSVTDTDTEDSHTFALTSDAGGRFAIDPDTGEITVADGSLLNYESATSHTVTVRVTDAAGTTYDETFTINITNVNEGPAELALDANSVVENAADGTVIGSVSVTDVDAGDSHTFALTSDAGGRFTIDPDTGEITVADGSLLNYEAATSHTVTVRVTDAAGATYDETFTINLTEVNEGPTTRDLSLTAEDGAPVTTSDLRAQGDDPDGDALELVAFTNPEHGRLVNNGDGTLTYIPTGGYSGSDTFTYTLSDGRGGTITGTITVQVEAAPTAEATPTRIHVVDTQRMTPAAPAERTPAEAPPAPELWDGTESLAVLPPNDDTAFTSASLTIDESVTAAPAQASDPVVGWALRMEIEPGTAAADGEDASQVTEASQGESFDQAFSLVSEERIDSQTGAPSVGAGPEEESDQGLLGRLAAQMPTFASLWTMVRGLVGTQRGPDLGPPPLIDRDPNRRKAS